MAGAGGASGAIYRWLQVSRFPADVVNSLRREGDAHYHSYASPHFESRNVIHVAAPDLNGCAGSGAEAVGRLTTAYHNVLREFARSAKPSLRMLPISGGIFAGPFARQMPAMTRAALSQAWRTLASEHRTQLIRTGARIDLCIFGTNDFAAFTEEFDPAPPHDGAGNGGHLPPAHPTGRNQRRENRNVCNSARRWDT
jgi:hypothetical protein